MAGTTETGQGQFDTAVRAITGFETIDILAQIAPKLGTDQGDGEKLTAALHLSSLWYNQLPGAILSRRKRRPGGGKHRMCWHKKGQDQPALEQRFKSAIRLALGLQPGRTRYRAPNPGSATRFRCPAPSASAPDLDDPKGPDRRCRCTCPPCYRPGWHCSAASSRPDYAHRTGARRCRSHGPGPGSAGSGRWSRWRNRRRTRGTLQPELRWTAAHTS